MFDGVAAVHDVYLHVSLLVLSVLAAKDRPNCVRGAVLKGAECWKGG